jgi:hypothetical protein
MVDRLVDIDDDGTGLKGTVRNNAWLQALFDAVDTWRATTLTSALTGGTVNDYDPGLGTKSGVVRLANLASAQTITGLKAGADGQVIVFTNPTVNVVSFPHQSGSSAAANGFFNMVTSGPTPITQSGNLVVQYDGAIARWRLIAHEQGNWITSAYAAGNFTVNGGTSWTVDSGDITALSYRLRGRAVTVQFYVMTTSVAGTPAALQITNGAWGGFTAVRDTLAAAAGNDNATGLALGFCQAGPTSSATKISIYRPAAAVWSVSTNNTSVYGEIEFEVQ